MQQEIQSIREELSKKEQGLRSMTGKVSNSKYYSHIQCLGVERTYKFISSNIWYRANSFIKYLSSCKASSLESM